MFRKNVIIFLILFSHKINAQTWQKIDMHFLGEDTLLSNSKIVFVTKNIGWIFTTGSVDANKPPNHFSSKIFKTPDGGHNWLLQKNIGNIFATYSPYALDSLHCWAVDQNGNLIFTSDGGDNWNTSKINSEAGDYFTLLFFFNAKNGIAFNRYRWFTIDGGYSWMKDSDTTKIFPSPSDIYFTNNSSGWIVSDITPYSTDAGYIAATTDSGNTWNYQDSITVKMLGIYFINSFKGFVVGTNWNNNTGFIYYTDDGGNNWIWKQFIGMGAFWDVGFFNDSLGWIIGDGKILRTINGGATWETQIQGLQSQFKKLTVLKKEKIAYIFGKDNYQNSFTLLYANLEGITDTNLNGEIIPDKIRLFQNYPNPFNPSTIIQYQIPVDGKVKIEVYDILGKKVEDLIDRIQAKGKYGVIFDADKLSSGVYYYQIQVDGSDGSKFFEAKKMLLLK